MISLGGWTIAQVYDGGFVVVGDLGNLAALARVGANGDSIWLRCYPDDEFDHSDASMECCISPDSNIAVATQYNVVKLSVDNGDIIWRCILDDRVRVPNVRTVGNDGFLVTGFTGFFDNAYAALISLEGELIWEREYESDAAECCTGFTSVTAGGWCLTVNHRFGDGGNDLYPKLIRIDDDGEIIWQRIYEEFDPSRRCISGVLETSDGGFVAVGESGGFYFYALRTDYAGEVLWQTEYGR